MAVPPASAPDDETYTGTPFSAPSPGAALEAGDEHDQCRTDVEVPTVPADREAQKAETSGPVLPPEEPSPPPKPAAASKPPTRTKPNPDAKPPAAKPKAEAKAKVEAKPKAAPPAPPEEPAAKANPAASSRRSSTAGADKAASSRRTAVSSRRILTPDERAKRRRMVLIIAGSVLAVSLVAAAFVMLSTSGSDHRRVGQETYLEAERQFSVAQNALANRRAGEARTAYEQTLKLLTDSAELGHAAEMPAEDPLLVKDLARQAWDLRGKVEALKSPLTDLEAETKADANLAAIQARLGTLADPKTDIDVLDRDIRAFMANPVDPKAGPDETRAATYARLANQAKLRLSDIEAERQRRESARSVTPVRQAELKINGLIQEERFGDALAHLDEQAKAYPGAKFDQLRATVQDAAGKAWKAAKAYADTRLSDYRAPGSGEAMRKQALAGAKKRLNEVVERFGMPEYVSQAKDMLAKLP